MKKPSDDIQIIRWRSNLAKMRFISSWCVHDLERPIKLNNHNRDFCDCLASQNSLHFLNSKPAYATSDWFFFNIFDLKA